LASGLEVLAGNARGHGADTVAILARVVDRFVRAVVAREAVELVFHSGVGGALVIGARITVVHYLPLGVRGPVVVAEQTTAVLFEVLSGEANQGHSATYPLETDIIDGVRVAVVTRDCVVGMNCAHSRVAAVVGAHVVVVDLRPFTLPLQPIGTASNAQLFAELVLPRGADLGRQPLAHAFETCVVEGHGIAVVARCEVVSMNYSVLGVAKIISTQVGIVDRFACTGDTVAGFVAKVASAVFCCGKQVGSAEFHPGPVLLDIGDLLPNLGLNRCLNR